MTHPPLPQSAHDTRCRYQLTQYAHGGGCACKTPPGELGQIVSGLTAAAPAADPPGELIVGLDDGDDAAVVRLGESDITAVIHATVSYLDRAVDAPRAG